MATANCLEVIYITCSECDSGRSTCSCLPALFGDSFKYFEKCQRVDGRISSSNTVLYNSNRALSSIIRIAWNCRSASQIRTRVTQQEAEAVHGRTKSRTHDLLDQFRYINMEFIEGNTASGRAVASGITCFG